MKNYELLARAFLKRLVSNQLFRVMKVTAFLLLIGCLHLSAASRSQTVTLNVKGQSLKQVFETIEKQTGYWVVYSDQLISSAKPITIDATDMALTSFLDKVLKPQSLAYTIDAKNILIMSSTDRVAQRPVGLHQPDKLVSVPLQQRVIRGKVKDEDGSPIQSATVAVKNTRVVAFTDEHGNYEIETQGDNVVLVFSIVGYENNEQTVGGRTTVDVMMVESISDLDEVVVVGYGTQKKSDLTGSLSSVDGEDINAFPTTNALQALSGRAAGVQVIQNTGAPGGAVSVRVRGTNSIRGSNEPLYVVDGFPMTGSNPTVLNNSDIESIEVLKDASATAIYGSRGANGVVLITTRKGRSGVARLDYESTFSVQELRKKLELMNAKEFASFYNEMAENDGLAQRFTPTEINALGEGFDWQDFTFRTALMQNHSLTLSGGHERTQFLASASVFKQDGIIRNSNYDRYSLRTYINHDFTDRLAVNANVILTRINVNNQSSGGGSRGSSLVSGALSAMPTVTPYNDDGSIRNLRVIYPWAHEISNPAYFLDEAMSKGRGNKVLGNLAVAYKPLSDLTVRLAGGIEFSDDNSDYYSSTRYLNGNSSASASTSELTSLLGEATLTYYKTFGKHDFTALGGFTYQDFHNTSLSASGVGFLSDIFETYNIGAAESPGVPQTGYSLSVLLSTIARLNYNYDDKILATVSFRGDGSSKYSKGNKWGYFPSAALAWRISNEEFLKGNDVISDLKLRAGWGVTGSQAIEAYSTLNRLSSSKTAMGDGLYNTFGPATTLPGNLRWESTSQTNVGIDASFIDNRVRLTIDYYKKITKDLLNPVPMPASTGYINTVQNVGSINNSGLELDLGADILRGNVNWSVDGNISFNRSKVVKLFGGEDILGSNYNITLFNDPINILREGEPFGVFYGYVSDGYDETGRLKYKDLNDDGVLTLGDKQIIGDPNPSFFYGLTSSVSYKNFELSVFLQGVSGNDIFNLSAITNTMDVFSGVNMPRAVYTDRWTPQNTNTKYPLPSTRNPTRVSDRFIENGSYLRLRNVQINYDVPFNNLNAGMIKKLQLTVGGQNLLTFTKYSWWDPEVNSSGGSSSVNQGIDFHTYPNYKSIIFGVKAQF